MSKTTKLIGISIILFFAGALYLLYAQDQVSLENPEHQALGKKIDALAQDVRKTNAEMLKKIDQILTNQDKTFKELDIIRVRASRSH